MAYPREYLQQKAYDVYTGNYKGFVNSRLAQIHYAEKAAELSANNNPTRNVLRKCSFILANLYNQSPRRRTGDAVLDRFLKKGIVALGSHLEEVSRLVYGVADWFIAPYPNQQDKKIYLDLLEPWQVKVSVDRGRTEWIQIPLVNDQSVRWFPDGTYKKFNKKGKQIDSGDSGLGVLPVVWFRLNPVSNSEIWGIDQVMDLVDGTIDLGVVEAWHKNNMYLRSINVLSPDGGEPDAGALKELQIGNNKVLPFGIKATSLADPNDPFGSTVDRLEQQLAATRFINPLQYSGEVTSSDQVATVSEGLREQWNRGRKIFSPPEQQLLEVCLALGKKNFGLRVPEDLEIFVDYIEPAANIEYQKKALEVLDQGMTLGVKSPVDFMLADNPDIADRKKALELLDQNAGDRALVNKYQREHNQPKDLDKPTERTPEENGALGGKMGGKSEEEKEGIREAAGGNGPTIVSKPYRD